MSTRRRRFDKQFKLDAASLINNSDRAISEIARDLGVRRELLYKWRRQFSDDPAGAFPGKGKLKPEEEELRRLRRELERITEERDILKKALGVFSRRGQ
jgi:transposase